MSLGQKPKTENKQYCNKFNEDFKTKQIKHCFKKGRGGDFPGGAVDKNPQLLSPVPQLLKTACFRAHWPQLMSSRAATPEACVPWSQQVAAASLRAVCKC